MLGGSVILPLIIYGFTFSRHFLPSEGIHFDSTRCSNGNKTVYLRTEAVLVEDPPAVTLVDLTLNECAKKCTSNIEGIDCRSFEYNSEKQSCALKESNGQPFGRSILSVASQPGVAFFQKICIPSEELCSAPYTFERFPQHVLSGHSMEVLATDNLSACLLECLESRKRMRVDCRSVMYFYESGQCILNRERQKSSAPRLFSNDTHFQLVDYFENNCFDINCFGESQLHWIRAKDFRINPRRDVVLGGLTGEQCRQACLDNQVGIEVFPCKAYVYSSIKSECQLTAESGVQYNTANASSSSTTTHAPLHGSKEALTPLGTTNSADEDSDVASLKQGIDAELSDFSAGEYLEKICLTGGMRCKEASFELSPNRRLESKDKVLATTSLNHCLQQCLLLGEECASAMFLREADECVLNKKSQFSHTELFHPASGVDYYDNVCELVPGSRPSLDVQAGAKDTKEHEKADTSMTIVDPELEKPEKAGKHPRSNKAQRPRPVFGGHIGVTQSKVVMAKKETVETECRLSGIQILAHFNQPNSGALFVKDHSSTCSSSFEDTFKARLLIPLPSSTDSNPKCAGVELSPNLWQFVVVLQKNNLGIPSLMTGSDRVFNVTCDFSNLLLNAQSDRDRVAGQLEEGGNDTSISNVTNSHSKVLNWEDHTVHMALLRAGKPVTTVSLGEELELRWTFDRKESEVKRKWLRKLVKRGEGEGKDVSLGFGFFVENCTAERLDGVPPNPPPLPLIVDGCPEAKIRDQLMHNPISKTADGFNTSVKVFRFDGSRRVRIRCSVNICVDECNPAVCVFGENVDNSRLSFGRKRKKRQTIGELAELMEKYDKVRNEVLRKKLTNGDTIQQSTITGSYTIVDGALEPVSKPSDEPGKLGPQSNNNPSFIHHSGDPSNSVAIPQLRIKNDSVVESSATNIDANAKNSYLTNSNCEESVSSGSRGAEGEASTHPTTICLQRIVFIALIVVVAFLTTVQVFHLLQITCKKCVQQEKETEDENSSLFTPPRRHDNSAASSRHNFNHQNNNNHKNNSGSTGSEKLREVEVYKTYLHSPTFLKPTVAYHRSRSANNMSGESDWSWGSSGETIPDKDYNEKMFDSNQMRINPGRKSAMARQQQPSVEVATRRLASQPKHGLPQRNESTSFPVRNGDQDVRARERPPSTYIDAVLSNRNNNDIYREDIGRKFYV